MEWPARPPLEGGGGVSDQPTRLHLGSPKSELSISSFFSIGVRLLIIIHHIYKKSVKVYACTEAHIIFIIQLFEYRSHPTWCSNSPQPPHSSLQPQELDQVIVIPTVIADSTPMQMRLTFG